jgi:phospholipid/cholesterol/gamma-HCH transport system substrate-binding protein
VAAKPLGEEKGPAKSRGFTPARIAVFVGLAALVIALGVVLFGGSEGYKYNLLFQNAGQLVPDNQVQIGGQPVGSIESIDLTEDNLAEVKITSEQQLHAGTTAVIRATSLSGVANHYVSLSPGPNNRPTLAEGATLGLSSTTTPVDLDQLFSAFPTSVRRDLSAFIKGNASVFKYRGSAANLSYKYLGPSLNRTSAFLHELSSDQRLFERFIVSTAKLSTAVSARGNQLTDAVSHATTAFGSIARQNVALSHTLQLLPPVFRQSNTTFVNLRAALDDLDPLVETAKPATKNLAPFLAELRPVVAKAVPLFRNLRLTVRRKGFANDGGELLALLPDVQKRAGQAFPHAEGAIAAFQPTLNFARAYTPDFFNGLAKTGQITGYYDANGHYARVSFSDLNIFSDSGGVLKSIPASQQYEPFGGSASVRRPCPGGATQPAPDGSNPFVEPRTAGAGVTTSECNPSDSPPGP